jgi:hypothetical protein
MSQNFTAKLSHKTKPPQVTRDIYILTLSLLRHANLHLSLKALSGRCSNRLPCNSPIQAIHIRAALKNIYTHRAYLGAHCSVLDEFLAVLVRLLFPPVPVQYALVPDASNFSDYLDEFSSVVPLSRMM